MDQAKRIQHPTVAVGTSVPELATTVIAKLRGHDEIGLGTILGSNIYNGILIVAVAAIICPITVPKCSTVALGCVPLGSRINLDHLFSILAGGL